MLVGVNDSECLNCGRKNPGMWGFGSAIRSLGHFGFTSVVTWGCAILYVATLIVDSGQRYLSTDTYGGRLGA